MENKFILITVFALFSLSLFSQEMSVKSTMYDKGKQEKIDNGDSSLTKKYLQSAQVDILDVGYQIGVGDYQKNRFFLNAFWGYQIRPYFILGYGWAMRYYYEEEAILLPFITEFRLDLPEKTALPFLAIRVGSSLELTNSKYFKDTGFLLNFSLGYNFHISNDILFNMEVGYAFQEADIYDDSGLNNDVGLHAISFSVGILR